EMAGKDLIDSVKLSGEIARALGAQPPEGFNYELFLDEKGSKISKSKGNGLTIEEWLRYASPESLSLFMYREPKAAKRLYFDAMVGYAINYYRDFVAPTKRFREPTATERKALTDLRDALSNLPQGASAEDIQNVVYEIGRREPFLDHKKPAKDGRPGVSLDWF